ncbi:riboflavin synthase [Candidatus Desantisbacteria bacterium]|nr:riboflavin synthase [Candidatus Desantisbacteria bacterium]
MFTGIIEEIGTIKQKSAYSIVIGAEIIVSDLRCGDSVAVNGTCLTATKINKDSFAADISPETLRLTNLQNLTPGDKVNMERALKLESRMGGHLVTGHIDGIIKLIEKKKDAESLVLRFSTTDDLSRYIIKKGSVCVDGVSLTVVDITGNIFSVCVIPHTAHQTTLFLRQIGYLSNLEVDIIGKYIEKLIQPAKQGLTNNFLAEHGLR